MRNIYPTGDIETVKEMLIRQNATIAVAESVTAGHLQVALSQAVDARRFFQGGITAYNVGQKCHLLKVEPIHALEYDGVSAPVAEQMARRVTDVFCSHYGVGVTGYAAPVPEKGILQPYAFFSVCGREGNLRTARLDVKEAADAFDVQLYYVERIITALTEILE